MFDPYCFQNLELLVGQGLVPHSALSRSPLLVSEHMFVYNGVMSTQANTKIILGIDPGLANTGWGVIEAAGSKSCCLGYGCITTAASEDTAVRLKIIHDDILEIVACYEPSALAIETIFFGANVKTEVVTAEARGAALIAAADAALEVGEYSPLQIKAAVVGTGSTEKSQVQYMVRALLGLKDIPSPDHAADALAAALCHARMGKHAAYERNAR